MEPSSFFIEFHQHLTERVWEDFLRSVSRAGASVEKQSSHNFQLTCVKRSQLQHVGYIVFGVGHGLCMVRKVTGEAQIRAGAYTKAFPHSA